MNTNIEVVFSFDTTGSMYPCLTQVRKNVKATAKRLFEEIPGIKIGITAHGDYCDESIYITKHLALTDDAKKVADFIENVPATGGGDAPEAYERVLKEARHFPWTAGHSHALVMIGDEVPHKASETPDRCDWNAELDALAGQGVQIYGVQALNRKHATSFYKTLAEKSGGYHISLDQFAQITDLVMAICFQRQSADALEQYEREVAKEGRLNKSTRRMFDAMLKREPAPVSASDLAAVPPGRFQVLTVDKDCSIKDFVKAEGLSFKVGRGFYEFTKTETIQGKKEVVLMDKTTGDLFAGEKAREMLGLPEGESIRLKPTQLEKFAVFVQSTSANRKLIGNTRFLYEIEDFAA